MFANLPNIDKNLADAPYIIEILVTTSQSDSEEDDVA